MYIAVMLEEVQVPPGLLLEVMRRAGLTADRAGVLRPAIGLDRQMQLMWLLVGIQSLVHQFPRGLYTQPKKQYLVAVHSGSSLRIFRVIWHRLPGEFHSKRQGAYDT